MIEDLLRDITYSTLSAMQVDIPIEKILLEVPKFAEHGDYACNIAFTVAKQLKKPPPIVAEEICVEIARNNTGISVKPINGFINFVVSDELLHDEVIKIDETYGRYLLGEGSSYLIEFVSANPTGPLHIGHGRWAAVGDSIVRILKEIGIKVTTEFYINNAGNQINKFKQSIEAVKSNQPIPEDGYHGEYIKDLAQASGDPIEIVIDQQKQILDRFGCFFDNWFYESSLHQSAAVTRIIDLLKQKGVTYESEMALWLKSTAYGDDKDRVLIRANGEPTYFVTDVAYHFDKYARGFDHVVDIWGADHHGYIKRMQAAIQVFLPDKKIDDIFTVLIGQLVRLYRDGKEVRMSKRTGDIITLEEVIDEIGVDAARYFLVMKSCDQLLDFDLNLAKEQSNNNPVYYVQYAHARICNIMAKAEHAKEIPFEGKLDEEERKLLKKLILFPGVLTRAAMEYTPYILAQYAQELAIAFHSFYQCCRVIGDDKKVMARRLAYIGKVRIILKKILYLLGVEAPERM